MKKEPIAQYNLESDMIPCGTHIQLFTSKVSSGTNNMSLIQIIRLLAEFITKTYHRAGPIQKTTAAHGGNQI